MKVPPRLSVTAGASPSMAAGAAAASAAVTAEAPGKSGGIASNAEAADWLVMQLCAPDRRRPKANGKEPTKGQTVFHLDQSAMIPAQLLLLYF